MYSLMFLFVIKKLDSINDLSIKLLLVIVNKFLYPVYCKKSDTEFKPNVKDPSLSIFDAFLLPVINPTQQKFESERYNGIA